MTLALTYGTPSATASMHRHIMNGVHGKVKFLHTSISGYSFLPEDYCNENRTDAVATFEFDAGISADIESMHGSTMDAVKEYSKRANVYHPPHPAVPNAFFLTEQSEDGHTLRNTFIRIQSSENEVRHYMETPTESKSESSGPGDAICSEPLASTGIALSPRDVRMRARFRHTSQRHICPPSEVERLIQGLEHESGFTLPEPPLPQPSAVKTEPRKRSRCGSHGASKSFTKSPYFGPPSIGHNSFSPSVAKNCLATRSETPISSAVISQLGDPPGLQNLTPPATIEKLARTNTPDEQLSPRLASLTRDHSDTIHEALSIISKPSRYQNEASQQAGGGPLLTSVESPLDDDEGRLCSAQTVVDEWCSQSPFFAPERKLSRSILNQWHSFPAIPIFGLPQHTKQSNDVDDAFKDIIKIQRPNEAHGPMVADQRRRSTRVLKAESKPEYDVILPPSKPKARNPRGVAKKVVNIKPDANSDSSKSVCPPHDTSLEPSEFEEPPVILPPKRNKSRGPIKSEHFLDNEEFDRKKPIRHAGKVSANSFPPLDADRFGLIQEELVHEPFWLLIAVTFLTLTTGRAAVPVFRQVRERWPSPMLLMDADNDELLGMIAHLGLVKRLKTYKHIARFYVEDPPVVGRRYRTLHYPGHEDGRDVKPKEILEDVDNRLGAWEIGHITQGRYALDSWRIFCRDVFRGLAQGWKGEGARGGDDFEPEWKRVTPLDKELRAILRWMWLKEGWYWDADSGERFVASELLMRAAAEGRIAWDKSNGDMRIVSVADVENGAFVPRTGGDCVEIWQRWKQLVNIQMLDRSVSQR